MTTEEMLLDRLARIEEKLAGVDRLEKQMAAFAGPWETLTDLGRDLNLLMDPAYKKLTESMAEVEIGFQLEDFFALIKRFLLSLKYLTWAMEQLENLVDWWNDMEPLMKVGVPKLIDYLDNLEQKGIFAINTAVLEMYSKIAAHYSPEDIDTIGDGFVQFHEIVRKLANPQLVGFLEKLVDLPLELRLDEVKPVGPWGMTWKMRSPECRRGLGVMLEMTRALGKLKTGRPEAGAAEA
jgi:uncharacterized protein YjgD (DUF1641 family)